MKICALLNQHSSLREARRLPHTLCANAIYVINSRIYSRVRVTDGRGKTPLYSPTHVVARHKTISSDCGSAKRILDCNTTCGICAYSRTQYMQWKLQIFERPNYSAAVASTNSKFSRKLSIRAARAFVHFCLPRTKTLYIVIFKIHLLRKLHAQENCTIRHDI